MKRGVNEAWAKMLSEYIRNACSGFRARIEQVIAAEGGYID